MLIESTVKALANKNAILVSAINILRTLDELSQSTQEKVSSALAYWEHGKSVGTTESQPTESQRNCDEMSP